ncbi:MAG: transcription antitermination factor NusB [Phascolarctobacterium sp.]|nr:MAG: transcription antitermination factor NusB [Phascolarctobacterium sp.]
MIRRIARELVVQSLFQIDFSGCTAEEALAAAVEEHNTKDAVKAQHYAQLAISGILNAKADIDAKIQEFSIDWEIERMPGVDRNILRLAVYEIYYAEEKIPAGIAINEAVEIAKLYGSEDSPRFINGLLGKMVRNNE